MGDGGGGAPGWYADPTRRHQHRYWDGSTWTDQVSDAGVTGVDPPIMGPATGQTTPTAQTPPPRVSRRVTFLGIVIPIQWILLPIMAIVLAPISILAFYLAFIQNHNPTPRNIPCGQQLGCVVDGFHAQVLGNHTGTASPEASESGPLFCVTVSISRPSGDSSFSSDWELHAPDGSVGHVDSTDSSQDIVDNLFLSGGQTKSGDVCLYSKAQPGHYELYWQPDPDKGDRAAWSFQR